MRKRDIEVVKRSFCSKYKKSEWRFYKNKDSLTFTNGPTIVRYSPGSNVLFVDRDRKISINTTTNHSNVHCSDVGEASFLSLDMLIRSYTGNRFYYFLRSESDLVNLIDPTGSRYGRMSVSEVLACFAVDNQHWADHFFSGMCRLSLEIGTLDTETNIIALENFLGAAIDLYGGTVPELAM